MNVYPLTGVRVGHTGDEKKKEFFVKGQTYALGYKPIAAAADAYKKDYADSDIKAPADLVLAGVTCFCIPRAAGDPVAHQAATEAYFAALTEKKSDALATHFKLGNNHLDTQAAHNALITAYKNTASGFNLNTAINEPTEIFGAGDAVSTLLARLFNEELITQMIPADIPAGFAYDQARKAASASAAASITGALAPADAAFKAADEVVIELQKQVREKTPELLEKLVPLLTKALDVVKEKVPSLTKPAEEKSEDEKSFAIGDVIKQYNVFEHSVGGVVLGAGLGNAEVAPTAAVAKFTGDLNANLEAGLNKATEGVEALLSEKFSLDIPELNALLASQLSKLLNLVKDFSGFNVLSDAVNTFAKGLDAVTETTSAEAASTATWNALSQTVLPFYQQSYALGQTLDSVFAGADESVSDPYVQLNDELFQVRVRGLNAIRVKVLSKLTYTENKLDVAGYRAALQESVQEIVSVLLTHQWQNFGEAVIASLIAWAKDWFKKNIMPTLTEALAPLQELIPEAIASAVNLAMIVETVVGVLFGKILTPLGTKVIQLLEEKLFVATAADPAAVTALLAAPAVKTAEVEPVVADEKEAEKEAEKSPEASAE